MKAIVADSSTLITLLDTNNSGLLFELFEQILIAKEVYREITCQKGNQAIIDGYAQDEKLLICDVVDKDELYEMLIKRLDKGESESIVLAKKNKLPLLIDEKKGRAIAKSLGIAIVGLIGVLLKLMETEVISRDAATAIVNEIENHNFRLSHELKKLIFEYQRK